TGGSEAESGNTFVFRRPTAGPAARAAQPSDGARDEGTMTFRAVSPRTGAAGAAGAAGATGGPGFAAGKAAAARTTAPTAPSGPQRATGPAVPHQAAAAPHQPAAPLPQAAAPQQPAAPVAAGPGGGQTSWAQQVHRLAGTGEGEPSVAPWKPPVEDVFQAAARRQAAARPAGLGKRLAARLIDTVVLGAVTAVAAVPLGLKAVDHVNGKIDEAKLSGETVTVWLLDGTTSAYLGIVLAVLLLFGVVYEALPTAKWGRTLGKKLLGLEVRDIEAHEPPAFGAALRRWLVYSVPGLLAVGLVGVVWCLFDRPWHQCWHDKAANTFVAG
ncbi:RDD family protein, partial [Streptomyces rochei]